MTREEKANKLGQEYFPDECNIWTRANFEAQWVSEACIKMAEWEHKMLVEKACEWLKENLFEGYDPDNYPMVRCYNIDLEDFIKEFSREMEE